MICECLLCSRKMSQDTFIYLPKSREWHIQSDYKHPQNRHFRPFAVSHIALITDNKNSTPISPLKFANRLTSPHHCIII